MIRKTPAIRLIATSIAPLAVLLSTAPLAVAAPPDLTAGEVPGDSVTINLGATGLRGWVYHVKANTDESRQVLITALDSGSPADGVLAVNDVILGADGTGANPVVFTADARRSLALAIADAESRNPGILKLLRWRAGTSSTVQITLRTMGAYTATAPYHCPKSTKILEEGAQDAFDHEDAGRYSFGSLSLLASGNPAYAARVRTEARALILTSSAMAQMMSDERDSTSMITWQRGHTLVFLAEYHLATGDTEVLPTIEAYAVNIAKNQSLFGTVGHIFAEKNTDGSHNGPMGGVYGVVNSTGLPCFLGLLLAKECGLTNPELDPAIERTSRFFSYYAGKGAIPYGEHEPYIKHESNGKSGLAAVAFALQANRVEEGKFFAKMATAAAGERETGHTGAFFNYLWSPLGAACGGEEAAAAHFGRISWMLDLNRRWDGGFDYDCLNGEGPNSGSQYNSFRMSTAALLVYALPLRELHITGRAPDPDRWLSSADVAEAAAADTYDADSRSTSELVTDLGNWSPKVQKLAAEELGTRSISTSLLSQITALANDPTGTSRIGACRALGEIGDSSSAATLAALLTDPENHVRFMAAKAMRELPTSAKLAQLDTILAAADSTSKPLVPYDEEDPLHFAHGRLGMLLFYSGNAYGPKGIIWNDLTGVDRNLLYPAIRAIAATPVGQARSTLKETYRNLTYADTVAVADAIVASVQVRAPADKMFSSGVRQGGIEALQKYGFAEGVPLSMIYMVDDGRGSKKESALEVLEAYAGSATTVVPDPDVIGFCEAMLSESQAAAAQAVLDAIANDPNPTPLTPLKSIQSIVPDAPNPTLPADSTVLRVSATDHALGDSIFTWRKVHGAGNVTFTPNGTTASADSAIQFDGTPGLYLFEVTMSDSRGLTEIDDTVPVTLYDSGGTLPPNDPPTTNPQQVPVIQATAKPITLSATDPEGYALTYTVTNAPAHGILSGSGPNLVYTPEVLFTGTDGFTYEVMDSEGQVASATIGITVGTATSFGVSIYEPFDYVAGLAINNQTGGIGFAGAWDQTRNTPTVQPESKTWGAMVTMGNHAVGDAWSGLVRPIGSTLADAGLMNNGATLWFSVVMDLQDQSKSNADINFALGTDQFVSSTYTERENLLGDSAEGIGVTHSGGRIQGVYWQDTGDADGYAERAEQDTSLQLNSTDNSRALVVGKIEWGVDNSAAETLTLYAPGPDLILGTPILGSWTTPALDQSRFDLMSVEFKDQSQLDEIRFADSYAGVLFGTTEIVATDYDHWAATYPSADLSDPDGDDDGDGLTNNEERIWGLDPTSDASVSPLSAPFDATGAFTYTRRDPELSGLIYTVWTSPNLVDWTQDPAASAGQLPGTPDANDVETVAVTLTAPPADDRLFVRIQAAE